MISIAVKLSRSTTALSRTVRIPGPTTSHGSCTSPGMRLLHDQTNINGPNSNPVVLQMINYALSHARSQKTGHFSFQPIDLARKISHFPKRRHVEMRMQVNRTDKVCWYWSSASLLNQARVNVLRLGGELRYLLWNFAEAIEKLQRVENLKQSSLAVRVAAKEALVGLHLQLGEDDTSSVVADNCVELLRKFKPESGGGGDYAAVNARTIAVKGLVELIHGNVESAESYFREFQKNESCNGSAALSYGEYLHATRNFSLAKEFYQKVIEVLAEKKDFSDLNAIGSCNMALEEVSLAANFALGQLEAHMGNFADAEEILTRALTKTEEISGSNHPKVGVVLTCLALMFRNKAAKERSSAILIQEGLYRRALEFLKAPPLESEDEETKIDRRDIVALARGGYAETLCVQQNRKGEGEKMKRWAEAAWRNRRMSLAEALDFSEPSNKVLVIDARTSRAI
ncbi:hypothetical protein JRO89_XS12G0046900 [Xanthoceras sorbifolium]|uniref:Tetratricopeptide repeat (TPR)-like superfamily protein n=1 Tax=Xanthoceras sorbifolium TaxID=99658 RepID=A0ABQ8HB66_9ROSI|nr:hypothetical protein JRO89_XS12G0046900 [Xanthoceras sorbifolium]